MYTTEGTLPAATLPGGTRLLVLSPPMLGAEQCAARFLAQGLDEGEGGVLLTTDRDAASAAEVIGDHAASPDALARLGVADATGQGPPKDRADYHVEAVGSPADLTGLGMAFGNLSDRVREGADDGLRVVVDSLSSLLVYSAFERVHRFAHVLGGHVDRLDAAGLFLLQSDVGEQDGARFDGLFDGRLEFRRGERDVEYRLRGTDADSEWRPYDEAAGGAREPAAGAGAAGEEASDPSASLADGVSSLADAIERVTAAGYTLTVCNYTGDEAGLSTLREYLGRHDVRVVEAELSTDAPTDAALLHRGTDPVAVSSVGALHDTVEFDDLGGAQPAGELRPDVLTHVHRQQYTTDNGGKLSMLRTSRLVERRALEAGTGTLHAGFQRLGRIADEYGTRTLYERIAGAGVDVHLYGEPGPVPNEELYTTHSARDGELAESWFVVFDGGGTPARSGALVTREGEPDRYSGFWTFQPPVVDAVDDYLRTTYLGEA